MYIRYLLLSLMLCVSFLCSCNTEKVGIPGIVAEVNGVSIYFRDLEPRRSALFSGQSASAKPLDDKALYSQYRYALAGMISEEIICQYMSANKFVLDPNVLAEEEKRIRDDYPEGSFDEQLVERGVPLELWRKGLSRHLIVEQFVQQVLRPEITIGADEVERYYTEHKNEFVIPEQWHFLHIQGADLKEVAEATADLAKGKDAEATQKEYIVTIRDVNIGMDSLPAELTGALAKIKVGHVSQPMKTDSGYQSFFMVEKIASTVLDAAEVAKRVEQALTEEKSRSVYAEWLKKRLKKSTVKVTPLLAGAFDEAMYNSVCPLPPFIDAATAESSEATQQNSEAAQQKSSEGQN